jgi:hypothetical protein
MLTLLQSLSVFGVTVFHLCVAALASDRADKMNNEIITGRNTLNHGLEDLLHMRKGKRKNERRVFMARVDATLVNMNFKCAFCEDVV